jgi:outer membrane protein assembly complex protein YaeT
VNYPLRIAAILVLASGWASISAQENSAASLVPGASLLADTVQAEGHDKVVFTGEKAFTEAQLRSAQGEAIREIGREGATPARADDLAFFIGTYYRKAGYSQVAVDYEIRSGKVVIKINEGPLSLLRKITFTGNHVVDEGTLYQYMIGATPQDLSKDPTKFPYTSAEVNAGADRVRGLYLSKGYLKATVEAAPADLSADGTRADVAVHITEGPMFTIGEISFSGTTLYPHDKLVTVLGESTTGPFAPGIAEVMQHNLQSYYKAQGYYQAEVAVTANSDIASGGHIPIAFAVKPGPLFRFGIANVTNETQKPRLRPDFLPKRFLPLKGEVYDPKKIDETYREMLRTGLFDNLRVSLRPLPNDELAIDLTASEAKSKEVGFTLGYGSYEGFSIGTRLADRDLFGNGRPLTFSLDYSQRGLIGELLYVDPWFLDSRFTMRDRLYSEERQELGYDKNGIGARTDFTRKALPHLELGVFGAVGHENVTSTGIDDYLLGPLEYTVFTVGLTQVSDFRNDPINPQRGFIFNSSFEVSEVSGVTFTRSLGRFSYYLPLGKTMLAFGARVGYMSTNIDSIPIDLRFFNGGVNTVRSFAERELGPKSHGDPIGGNLYTVFNLEYTFPIVGALDGATFFDAGSLKNSDDDSSGDLRYGVGLGLRYKLPIGPVRLDYGVNPDRRTGEAFGAFNFSFGFAF